jgi:hypothetical protein
MFCSSLWMNWTIGIKLDSNDLHIYAACGSAISNTAIDRNLLVPNGSYILTANNCVMCGCSSSTWQWVPTLLKLIQAESIFVTKFRTPQCSMVFQVGLPGSTGIKLVVLPCRQVRGHVPRQHVLHFILWEQDVFLRWVHQQHIFRHPHQHHHQQHVQRWVRPGSLRNSQ